MTSNIGSEHIAKMGSLGFLGSKEEAEKKSLKEKVMEALKEEFRPEFLNRIDEIIIFNYLGKAEIKKIVDLELNKVVERLKNRKINIKTTEKAKQLLAEKGFDQNLGARPLKRVIQKLVLDPLSLKIVSGEIKEGDSVVVDAEEEKIIFHTLKDLIRKKKEEEKVGVK
jgi:ATP-dependent Clp protease ATP-binding subunit ClpA